ncbi:DUF1501 domain-containing protein [Planctomicrobium piriforme]|uniref:Tat (Twin-arginine translocation) pathway signal sequence n=1 Tax=Planctomicrobium piriforme TaxID=1576369 RepID=A0A1I3J5T2_9PLAN|nr:DUF1501 domain-containing protein [Planctomicrobium piriforme]SFI55543.1 Tat (twin-arginine translocation) pathway signal sequence [Planctomicrobium piriforme]
MFSNATRRDFLKQAAAGATGMLAAGGAAPLLANSEKKNFPVGKAEHCIMIWLGGGSSQIDTWDPKRRGDAKEKVAGSYYDPIDTAVPGIQVCEHLSGCAKILDRFNLLRTVHHEVIDEHAAATNRMHTGRPTSGSIVYPSIGSIVAHKRGAVSENAPAYILIGYPNVTRGPGFLGSKAGYVYLTSTEAGPSSFTRPPEIGTARQSRREQLLEQVRAEYLERATGGKTIRDYDSSVSEALRLSGPEFMSVFNLDEEPADLREAYGSEFGQRCLLSRRLLESGTRFIEVSHNLNFVNGTGWDTHNSGQLNQHLLIQDLDKALSTLVLDLESKQMLDKTLIVVASEFGRPAQFDNGGGRGHHGASFTVVLAGGGLQNGKMIGTTDELGMKIVDRPVSVPDMHATICCAMGINPSEELYAAGDRPVPITDQGQPIRELFA